MNAFKKRLVRTADRPDGFWGGLMIHKMNIFHTELSLWGLSFLQGAPHGRALDIGCGGGRNVARLHRLVGEAHGVDVSPLSVRRSVWHNLPAVLKGRTTITCTGADELPYADRYFDVVTAFETIYYWPDLSRAFREVRRVLRRGGAFLICNEDSAHLNQPDEHAALKELLDINFYTNKQIKKWLLAAGFSRVNIYEHENGSWVSIVAIA